MPLSAAKSTLETSIQAAFTAARNAGGGESGATEANGATLNDNSDNYIETLAKSLTNAIHAYATKAQVDISMIPSTCPPGIMVVTAGSPYAQVGATIMPIVTIHPAMGKLL